MEITVKQQKKIEEIAEKNELKLVILFGSQVHGKTHKESDVDIGILPNHALSFEEEVRLATECITVFGMKADFTNLYKASPLLLSEVVKSCRVLYQREPTDYPDFFVYAKQRYAEAMPLFVMTERSVSRFLNKERYDE